MKTAMALAARNVRLLGHDSARGCVDVRQEKKRSESKHPTRGSPQSKTAQSFIEPLPSVGCRPGVQAVPAHRPGKATMPDPVPDGPKRRCDMMAARIVEAISSLAESHGAPGPRSDPFVPV